MYFADEPEHVTQLRGMLRRFVAEEMPRDRVRQWDREHRFPPELFRKLASLGVCGLTIDEAYGGQGRDIVAAVAVIEELCRGGAFAAGPFIHCAFYGGADLWSGGGPRHGAPRARPAGHAHRRGLVEHAEEQHRQLPGPGDGKGTMSGVEA